NEDWLMEIRRQTAAAMERSPTVIREAYESFKKIFGRDYGNPFFEEYMTDDADVVLIGMGTLSNPVRVAIRQMRAEGKKVGFVRKMSECVYEAAAGKPQPPTQWIGLRE